MLLQISPLAASQAKLKLPGLIRGQLRRARLTDLNGGVIDFQMWGSSFQMCSDNREGKREPTELYRQSSSKALFKN
jgi:hypothetical protein